MMNVNQIQKLIEEAIVELKDITNIKRDLLVEEKGKMVEVALVAVGYLEQILAISKSEIQRSAGDKDKLFYLPR